MKKRGLMGLLAAGLLAGLLLPASVPVLANGGVPEWADKYELMAGQSEDVGDVFVWNDEVNLYVWYQTVDGWEMTETHLEIVCDLGDFPQTKKGNPQVGQFSYGEELDSPVTVWPVAGPFSIALDEFDCDSLVLAAHAAVQKCTGTETMALGSGDLEEHSVSLYATDPLETSPNPLWTGTPVETYSDHPAWVSFTNQNRSQLEIDDDIVWISSAYYAEGPSDYQVLPANLESWRVFTRSIVLPENACDIGGTLNITADNADYAFLNDSPVGQSTVWNSLSAYTGLGQWLQPGANNFEVVVHNFAGATSPSANPTGLVYRLDLEYGLLTYETAWAAGTSFPGSNWAMYFEYCIRDWVYLETIEVDAVDNGDGHSPTPVCSSEALAEATLYKLVADGIAGAGDTIDFDAKYSITNRISEDTWTDLVSGYETHVWGAELLDLFVDGVSVDWGPYNDDHLYEYEMLGTGAEVCFYINDTYPSNNEGSLEVDIYAWQCPD